MESTKRIWCWSFVHSHAASCDRVYPETMVHVYRLVGICTWTATAVFCAMKEQWRGHSILSVRPQPEEPREGTRALKSRCRLVPEQSCDPRSRETHTLTVGRIARKPSCILYCPTEYLTERSDSLGRNLARAFLTGLAPMSPHAF